MILGWETLLRDQFDLGLLERVTSRSVQTGRGYFACLTARAIAHPAAELFMDWLSALE